MKNGLLLRAGEIADALTQATNVTMTEPLVT